MLLQDSVQDFLFMIIKHRRRKHNLLNQQIGDLTPFEFLSIPTKSGYRSMYKCKCSCGKIKTIRTERLSKKIGISCFHRKPKTADLYKAIQDQYRNGAKRRNLEFKLDLEQFKNIVKSNCFYCNDTPNNTFKKNRKEQKYNGIDRKNNKEGYILTNCVACCKKCNFIKSNLDYYKFLEQIKKISININLINDL